MYPSSDQRISCVPPPELFPPMKDKQMAFCYPPRFCAFSFDKISNFSRSPISINGNISYSNPNKQATNDNKWQMGCSEKINYCANNVIGALHAMRFGWKIYI